MISVVEPCTMCLSACSQAGYTSVNFIIPAKPYITRFPYVTDGISLQKKQELAQNFSEKIDLIHLKQYEAKFKKIFDDAMKDLFIK
ncbi:hypothetical protein A2690_01700 [Candidatus Roizmanbacteria bacterium RIFCSPHIGHO2_01_FULL_39_12b]|uniref:CMP/dCMP-type deaminase domain-containing protein n=1 Tax=Candidatus Roizmanbacteria bacterium RIFCSPHIGHO2_01_FULL_39_12b TaxID=1802030 RepID=A0A1F7GC09_9BACT|nr:MAG: hypothetical protein A2690_01700 [Candidatus Roizmanbacteria bacterium RIFCSPHIGHO2_01_FULL_39_12b]OGK46135.1 MAG: hypothetical protein A3B46_02945 [Candidatus Roizmanbacteria bacterium RIFCSPLOWO2_01_FULL_39_19]